MTTGEGPAHSTVEGGRRPGGPVYFEIPADNSSAPDVHRFRLVVRVMERRPTVPRHRGQPSTPVFVSDVDGTLRSRRTPSS